MAVHSAQAPLSLLPHNMGVPCAFCDEHWHPPGAWRVSCQYSGVRRLRRSHYLHAAPPLHAAADDTAGQFAAGNIDNPFRHGTVDTLHLLATAAPRVGTAAMQQAVAVWGSPGPCCSTAAIPAFVCMLCSAAYFSAAHKAWCRSLVYMRLIQSDTSERGTIKCWSLRISSGLAEVIWGAPARRCFTLLCLAGRGAGCSGAAASSHKIKFSGRQLLGHAGEVLALQEQ